MSLPQQDRSRLTHQRLIDATIESLADVGWSGTSVVAVAGRAGVSRGAAQHHFPTLHDLVRTTCGSVIDDLGAQMREARCRPGLHEDRLLGVMELLTEMWASPMGQAVTHLWVAASTDAALRELLLPLEQQFSRELFRTTTELLTADNAEPPTIPTVRLIIDITRGVGLGTLLRHNLHRRKLDLAQWANLLAAIPEFGC